MTGLLDQPQFLGNHSANNSAPTPNKIDMPLEPRPQPDRPLDIVLGTRGADPTAPFIPRIVAKANGKIGLNVEDPQADLDIKADTIAIEGPSVDVSLPHTIIDLRGPFTLKGDVTVKLGGRLVISPPTHTWINEGLEVDLHRTNGAPSLGPSGFNVGAHLSAERGPGPKPYIGFRSEGPNPEDVRLNLSSSRVNVWEKQPSGNWYPFSYDIGLADRLSAEQKVAIEQQSADIAALKRDRPRLVFGELLSTSGRIGGIELGWCARPTCCEWRVAAPCPTGYSPLSGGCFFANTGWVPGRAMAAISVNSPSFSNKAWTCEARLNDYCVDVNFYARAICISDNTFGH